MCPDCPNYRAGSDTVVRYGNFFRRSDERYPGLQLYCNQVASKYPLFCSSLHLY